MKTASHNTMTFLRPRTWWGRLLRFMVRCQDLDLISQRKETGCSWFDLRIAFDKNGQPCFAHGLVDFDNVWNGVDYSPMSTLGYLDEFGKTGDIYVRILNERASTDQRKFASFCEIAEHRFVNIKFLGGQNKKDWKLWYKFLGQCPPVVDKYSSMNHDTKLGTGWHLDDLWPRIYAWTFNKKWRKHYKDSKVYLIQDFIGKY